MSGKYGGGSVACTACNKKCYSGERIMYEKKPYHIKCFRCTTCNKKKDAAKVSQFEGKLYCRNCFKQGGFAQKQTKVKWTKKTTTSSTSGSGKFSNLGGGGTPCYECSKSVYAGETVSYEKRRYHRKCFTCHQCKLDGKKKKLTASTANQFKDSKDGRYKLYCGKCWTAGGFANKQAKTKTWHKSTSTSTSSSTSSKFGGGGLSCERCSKTLYKAEAIFFGKTRKAYHAKCFTCQHEEKGVVCGKRIPSTSAASEFQGNVICAKCWKAAGYARKQTQLAAANRTNSTTTTSSSSKFGGSGSSPKCYICKKAVYPAELISYDKHIFHSKCLRCNDCNARVNLNNMSLFKPDKTGLNDVIICQKCWTSGEYRRKQLEASSATTVESTDDQKDDGGDETKDDGGDETKDDGGDDGGGDDVADDGGADDGGADGEDRLTLD